MLEILRFFKLILNILYTLFIILYTYLMVNLDTTLKSISRITPKYQKILEKMGLFTVRDFLLYFPFRYDDFRKITPLADEYLGQIVTIQGKIVSAKNTRTWKKRMAITEIIVKDINGNLMKSVWFNQPYMLDNLKIGSSVRFSGKLSKDQDLYSMSNPAWEDASRVATNTGRLVPVYPETAGISSKWIRWQMKTFLPLAGTLDEPLSDEIRKKYNLYDIEAAVMEIHFPASREKLVRAQKRMAFQEMFLMQLKTLKIKKDWEGKNSTQIDFDEKLVKKFVGNLLFKLTNAQRKTTYEILKDLGKPRPMNRLLNGDVGSGKTVVAGIAALETISAGHQVAIMAPTEILARQHFDTFCKLFQNYDISIALLTNSYKITCHPEFISGSKKMPKPASTQRGEQVQYDKREDLLKKIASDQINLAIGTHALIQKDVKFKNLALVIIDEQHRFGVAQRAALQSETMSINDPNKKTIPNLLTMTATPIPRTLAIAFFGSLDLSLLDEMPKNRKPIITQAVVPSGRNQVYKFIRQKVKAGRQAFIILPLVEESKSESMADVKAATQEHERLSENIFPELKLGLLHGRLKAKDKEEVMKKFNDKKIDILVSTSVVEVGIDIPNATVLAVENAERFGLTQLHQFRGRVGRGKHQSYCFLFSEKKNPRLKIMEKTNDGFAIAERDLELRGPGQFFGTLQSGIPDIAMENLGNIKLIKFARAEAKDILEKDPKLKKHPLLEAALKKFSKKIHLE